PGFLPVHRVGLVLWRDLVDRGHTRDVAEATERDRLDAVFGVAELVGPTRRPQGRTEAHEVAAHLHPGRARRPHVPALVQRHRHKDEERKKRDADDPHHHLVVTTSRETAPFARSRAQCCASSTSSTVAGSAAHWSAARRTSAIVRTIAGNRMRPARKAAAASSLAALSTAVRQPPFLPA